MRRGAPDGLFNGIARVPRLDRHRGFGHGDGVFRTCLIYDSEVIDLDKQIEKIANDARRLGLEPPGQAVLRREATRVAAGRRRATLKMYLLRSGGSAADRLLAVQPLARWPASYWTRGITISRSTVRLARQPRLAGIKHMSRIEYVMAEMSARRAGNEVLVNDDRGRPLEGTRSNLFWVRSGTLCTPSLEHCGVAGVVRARILELAASDGVRSRIRSGSWDELRRADEVFVCNSLVGVWPVRRFGRRRWIAPGAVTRQLMRGLGHPRQAGA